MAGASLHVTGTRPMSFTDSTGAQRFVPLSALELDGSEVKLKASWASSFSAPDATILLALAGERAASGDLKPPPVTPPVPAIAFTARTAGPESNGIVVTVTPDPGPPLTATIAIAAKEVDAYGGLTGAKHAAQVIGVDTPTGNPGDPPAGTGLVRVKASANLTAALPKDGQVLSVKAATPVLAPDDTTLFTLLPRDGYTGTGIAVTIAVDAVAKTFTLHATHDSGPQPKVTLQTLDQLAAPVKFLVSAGAPPGGLAPPAASTVPLSGGGLGIKATGVAYTT